MEYFVFEGDDLWNLPDDDLVALGTKELAAIGLVEASDVEAGYVVRMPKAYPVYDDTYRDNVEVIRRWFEQHAPNVHPVGRNGMHKYNNQDHSMYTAMLTVENIHGARHDIWSVNVEGSTTRRPKGGPAGRPGPPGGTRRSYPDASADRGGTRWSTGGGTHRGVQPVTVSRASTRSWRTSRRSSTP
jgi:hypothetical protein